MAKNFFSGINYRSYLAEFLGTFVFVLVSVGAIFVNGLYGNIGVLGVAIASGFSYMTMVFATIHLSGGHLNPAISLSLWLAKKLNSIDLFFYLSAQFLAGIAASLVLIYIFGNAGDLSPGFEIMKEGFSLQRAVIIEALFSAVLVFVYFSTLVDRRGPGSFAPLALGLVVTAFLITASSISGGFINPAKALGSAVIFNSYSELSAWIVGPFTGSLFGLVYEFLFLKKTSK